MDTLAQVSLQAPMNMPVNVFCELSQLPVEVKCPFCKAQVSTTVEKEAGMFAYMMCCAFTWFGGCICMPCLWNKFKDNVHYCSNCKKELGRNIMGAR